MNLSIQVLPKFFPLITPSPFSVDHRAHHFVLMHASKQNAAWQYDITFFVLRHSEKRNKFFELGAYCMLEERVRLCFRPHSEEQKFVAVSDFSYFVRMTSIPILLE